MFLRARFWHDVGVLYSIITASVCEREVRPTSYQQG